MMKRRDFARLLGGLAIVPALTPERILGSTASDPHLHSASQDRFPQKRSDSPFSSERRWSFVADVAECCSCAIPCPCNFGRPVETCHGNRLIQIRQGDHEGRDLAGVRFLVTFHMGQWTRIYADSGMNEAQLVAFDSFFPVGFAGFHNLSQVIERVPLTVESTGDTYRFSVPASSVEMRLLPGLGGAPIRIEGLPSPAFHDYVQYESILHRHNSGEAQWSYSRTNGFRSEMRASG